MNPDSPNVIPLLIGIVGHRDIAEEHKSRLISLIKKIFEEKAAMCPNTQIILLTPLAEGADRYAAWAAIECGIPYIAILPMPLTEYRKEFETNQSLHEFDQLLSKAQYSYELTVPDSSRTTSGQINTQHDDLYYNLGFFMARQSQMLIALWDGKDNNKTGGTAHTVSMKVNGVPAIHPYFRHRFRNIKAGPVCHIFTPRIGQVLPANAFEIKMIYGNTGDKKDAFKYDLQLINQLDSFNRDVRKIKNRLKSSVDARSTLDFHVMTDELARHYQSKRFFALKVLLILAVVAFLFFQIYVELWHKPLILLLYPVTIGLGAIWFNRASQLRFEQKHEDYRALSEAFRVQHFLTVTDNGVDVSDYYLQKHKGELEWVTYVLQAAKFISSKNMHNEPGGRNEMDNFKYINDHWVKEQEAYYRIKSGSYDKYVRNIKIVANSLFVGAIMASILLFIVSISAERHSDPGLTHSLLVLFTHSFLVISATLFGYNEKMIFEEQSKTYHQMYRLFSDADKELNKAIQQENPDKAREIIKDLGFESLMENGDWLLLHRSRPMEIPKG